MSDLRSAIEREIERIEPRSYPYEAFQGRRLRAARRRRAAATGLGLLVGALLVVSMVLVLRGRGGGAPATTPITPEHVSSLRLYWSHDTGASIDSAPVVAGDRVYVTDSGGELLAFPTACPTAPTCRPFWTGKAGAGASFDIGSPAVGDGMVFAASAQGDLIGYSTSCDHRYRELTPRGGPARCAPSWIASPGGDLTTASPVVADGVVYVGSSDGALFAYPTSCSRHPRPCAPLWMASLPGGFGAHGFSGAQPVVGAGVVYVGSTDGTLYAFPTSCGSPCRPLRELHLPGVLNNPLVLVGGTLYVTSGNHLYAYPTRCLDRDQGCGPDWIGVAPSLIVSKPAVGDGHVYVGSEDGVVSAFPKACGRQGHLCQPAWSIPDLGRLPNPSLLDGVLFVGSSWDVNELLAFDARCGGAGATCSPLWTYQVTDLGSFVQQTASEGSGTLFAATGALTGGTPGGPGGRLYAFRVGAPASGASLGSGVAPSFDIVTILTLIAIAILLVVLWRRRIARRLDADPGTTTTT
jgi:outer membrane protein assembly factor BamB